MDVAFNALRNVAFAIAAGIWVGSIAWVVADARARLVRPRRIHLATAAAALFPFVGAVAWLGVRPSETLEERRQRKLRRRALVQAIEEGACGHCGTELRDDFLCCPRCGVKVRNECDTCHRRLELTWRVCPHCASKVDRSPPAALRNAALL